jgi:UMF1 family MFS transporter
VTTPPLDPPRPAGAADLAPLERASQQKAWNWYDWANSAFYTTVLSVLFAPYMITVAGKAAGCAHANDACAKTVSVLGLHLAAGSLPSYLTSFATIASAFLLPIVGAFADRSARKKWHLAGYAYAGAFFAALLFFLKGENWQLGAVAVILASILGGCSLISYYAILVDISTEDERDSASSRGWAWGYLGGGLLLAINLVIVEGHDTFGISKAMAVRVSMLSAAIWWAGFTLIPLRRLRNYEPRNVVHEQGKGQERATVLQRSFGQLFTTLKELRKYPMTLTFLLAYLFFNDGIQTVIYEASTYGSKQLKFSQTVLIATILLIQFVAFGGALFFGRLARKYGSYRSILWGTFAWMGIVVLALFLPEKNVALFLALAVAIGVVLGGTQALSRSFFSLLIPRGREGEYFSLYGAAERGTSWFGTLLFGVMFQVTGSYRPAILALIIFFVLGAFFLLRLDPERGIREAGNRVPAVV